MAFPSDPHAATSHRDDAVFVGRDRELQLLRGGLDGALAGRGSLFVIAGEPGIGKTRLAAALSDAVQDAAWVLWGRCWEGGGAPPFWPWVQILRAYERAHAASGRGPSLEQAPADVAPLVRVGVAASGPGESISADVDDARFRLFDGVTQFLVDAAVQQPLVLILDDLHAADPSSLLLLQFLARVLRGARMVVIGTCREAEVRCSPMLTRAIAALGREGQSITLRGLSAEAVARMMGRSVPHAASSTVAAQVHQMSGGNPFYLDAILRLLTAQPDWPAQVGGVWALGIPDSVRETILRRLEPLRGEIRHLLALASVIGREFDLPVLARLAVESRALMAGPAAAAAAVATPEQLVDWLGEAVAAGIVVELAEASGRYGFSHALICETVRHELPPAQRMRLHFITGEVLEQRTAEIAVPQYAELAHHYFHAAAAGGAEKATRYATRAGEQAQALLAFEDAARHYELALESLKFREPDAALRCELLLRLGEAQRRGVASATSAETFQRAAPLARRLGMPIQLARAALGFARSEESGTVNDARIALLDEALAALEPGDSTWRARLMARLAMALYFAPAAPRREALSADAVAMARRLGDAPTLVATLVGRHFALWEPDSIDERLRVATELVQQAEITGEQDLAAEGRLWRLVDLFEAGDTAGFSREWNALAPQPPSARHRWSAALLRAMRALAEARLDDAERLAQAAQALGHEAQMSRADQYFYVQLFYIRRRQGRLAELEHAVRVTADQYPALPIWRCGLALLYADIGRTADAAALLCGLAAHGYADIPRDGNWLPALVQLGEVCATLDDAAQAAPLYDLLLPHAGRNAVIAEAIVYLGPVSHVLGRLATTLGRSTEAAAHFQAAIAMASGLDATPHADEAREAYRRLQAATVDAVPTPGSERAPEAVPAPVPAELRREGDYWTVRFAGQELRCKDARGLFYLNYLLARPGDECAATELVVAARGGAPPPARAGVDHDLELHPDGGGGDPLLDAAAKADYRRRVRELQADLDEAEALNDPGRAEQARYEIDQITTALSSALGLGGRDRTMSSHLERARIAVTKAVLQVLKSLSRDLPPLGDYLQRTIRTGRFCSYTQDPRQPVRWTL